MAKTVYSQKLLDPRWQKKRLEILERDEWTCRWCFDDESTLHVHHLWYVPGEPWDAPNNALITLCEACHEEETKNRKREEDNLLQTLRETRLNAVAISHLLMAIRESCITNEIDWDIMAWGIESVEARKMVNELWFAKHQANRDKK